MSEHSQPREQNSGTPAGANGKAAPSPVTLPPPDYDDPGVKRANRKAALVGVMSSIVALAVLILVIYLLLQNPALTANIRDIVIILTAIVLIITGLAISVLLVMLLYRIQELMHFLRAELAPILTETQKAAKAVYGTTMFMSDSVAKPAIKAASFFARVQKMAQAAKAKGSAGQR